MVRTRPAASQASLTFVAGVTARAAATEVLSIGALNSSVTGALTAWSVATTVRNVPAVTGRIELGGVAFVTAGRIVKMTPNARMAPRPMANALRTASERPSRVLR